MSQTGIGGVRAGIADAMRDAARQSRRRADPLPSIPRGDPPTEAGKWTPDRDGLPREEPCPVIPLGIDGSTYFVVSSSGQLRALSASDFSHAGIQSLFDTTPNYPEWAWPRRGRGGKDEDGNHIPGPIKSFEDDAVRKALFLACSRHGLFDPERRVRGRGAWALRDGGILYHAGEELWRFEKGRPRIEETGVVQGMLYPRLPAIPPPWSEKLEDDDRTVEDLVADLRSWTWDRPEVDPILLLGWLGVALIGGALPWRSAIFLIGDKATGKSTLQEFIGAILGDALLTSTDTSAAGIYQRLKNDARAVAIDELEAKADNRKAVQVMELARAASSGGFLLRGGADGSGTMVQLYCSFLFSAINPPPMMPQDLSRFAILRLGALAKSDKAAPTLEGDAIVTGRVLLRRLMQEWPRYAETKRAYDDALAAGGHTKRGQATYGTLLALADLLLGPAAADRLGIAMVDDLSFWSKALAAEAIPEVADALPNWLSCVLHILTSRVPAWRSGMRATVGQLLADLDAGFNAGGLDFAAAQRELGQAGIGLIAKNDPKFKFGGWGLAIPHTSPLLAELFAGTVWQGLPGAGGWTEALSGGRAAGAIVTDKTRNRVTVNGIQLRCSIINMAEVAKLMAPPAEADRPLEPAPPPAPAAGGPWDHIPDWPPPEGR